MRTRARTLRGPPSPTRTPAHSPPAPIAAPALDVALTPAGFDADGPAGRAVLVVDVLRAGTAVATALANGARAVIPAESRGEAGRLVATLDAEVTLFAGEHGDAQLPGFAAGSSPGQFTAEAVAGKTVVLLTSNGTPTLAAVRGAREVAVGALVNAGAAARFLRQCAEAGRPAVVVCAGNAGRVALEDALCAGLLVDRVAGDASSLGDGARIAHGLYRGAQADFARAFLGADHARRLVQMGAGEDVAACARIDALDVLPVLRDNRIVAG